MNYKDLEINTNFKPSQFNTILRKSLYYSNLQIASNKLFNSILSINMNSN
jgi:hypothetical protein